MRPQLLVGGSENRVAFAMPKAVQEPTARENSVQHANALTAALSDIVVGQPATVRQLALGLFADGHVLLEGVPGVGKTLLARSLACLIGVKFARVQFTPDLMPADLIGTRIFNPDTREWETQPGPVFTEILLADEINRTPPKTQSALLEAMEERQVTLDGERHVLSDAFFVIATENPLEFEGTYPLPEAQTDRFLLKVAMDYPHDEAELALLMADGRPVDRLAELEPVFSRDALLNIRQDVRAVAVSEEVARYTLSLLLATRGAPELKLGASPRAGLMLLSAARAEAMLCARDFVIPDDVKAVAGPVLRHRLSLSTEAELDGVTADDVLTDLLSKVAVRSGG